MSWFYCRIYNSHLRIGLLIFVYVSDYFFVPFLLWKYWIFNGTSNPIVFISKHALHNWFYTLIENWCHNTQSVGNKVIHKYYVFSVTSGSRTFRFGRNKELFFDKQTKTNYFFVPFLLWKYWIFNGTSKHRHILVLPVLMEHFFKHV
jgi:hypothetical protein